MMECSYISMLNNTLRMHQEEETQIGDEYNDLQRPLSENSCRMSIYLCG